MNPPPGLSAPGPDQTVRTRMRTNSPLLAAAALSAASVTTLIAGCSSASTGAGPNTGGTPAMTAEQAINALTGEWKLSSLNGRDASTLAGLGGKRPSIRIEPDGRLSGFGGVNRIGGAIDLAALAKGQFKTGPMFSTKMAGPPEAMQLEDDFTAALNKVRGFSVQDGCLSLTGEGTNIDFTR